MDYLYRESTGEVLIYKPSVVLVSQRGFYGDIDYYSHAGKRKSRLDSSTLVLDVAPAILGFYDDCLGIVEGHTRHAYAHLYGVGLEGFVVKNEEEITRLPQECFRTLSPSEVKDLFLSLPK